MNGAANWQWYSGSCGGTNVGSGTSISVSPTITTTYYVRGEGGCINAGNCASITLTMGPLPTLGNYPNKTVVAGRNTTVTPNAVPTNTVHAVAYANTNFKGILTVVFLPATTVLFG